MARKLIDEIGAILQSPDADDSTIIGSIRTLLDSAEPGAHAGVNDAQSINELYQMYINNWCGRKEHHKMIGSGFSGLNAVIDGFLPGEYVVVGARPGVGKTQLMIDMALHMSISTPVLFFAIDESQFSMSSHIVATLAELPAKKLLYEKPDEKELAKLAQVGNDLQKRSLYTSCGSIRSLSSFTAYCEEMITGHGVKVIFVDGIQSFTLLGFRGNRDAEVGMVSKELMRIARDNEVLVIATSQLSRALEWRKESKVPQLSDLRDSGSIEQHADKVLLMYVPEYYGITNDEMGESIAGETHLFIAKNRTGKQGELKLRLKQNGGGFRDMVEDPNGYITQGEDVRSFQFPQERLPDWV